MRARILPFVLALCLLLTGCSWLDGSYVSVTPHWEQRQNMKTGIISADNHQELMTALETLIAQGTESSTIYVAEYPSYAVESGMTAAIRHATDVYPLGAYAVEEISYELGSSGGQPAVAVTISYRHRRAEIRRINHLRDMDGAEQILADALEGYESVVVMLVDDYSPRDFDQMVQDYAAEHPQTVMETPQVTMDVYGSGDARVIELSFAYQTSRESMRQMQSQVKPVFDAAALYVSGDGSEWQKFSQLYAFLMERFDYKLETSITPAYSLLRHGVGDSRAFAVIYAAMCRGAGLECMTVTGTRSGEPWTWNIVLDNGYYYHVDLLQCNILGRYQELSDSQMQGYVWDYSAYPQCVGAPASEPEKTRPTSAATEPDDTKENSQETEAPSETEPTDETIPPEEKI